MSHSTSSSPRIIHRFTIGPDHPSLPGHFPGRPIVPGVVLLSEVLAHLPGTLLTAKFLAPVEPGIEVELHTSITPNGKTAFTCTTAGKTVLNGTLAP